MEVSEGLREIITDQVKRNLIANGAVIVDGRIVGWNLNSEKGRELMNAVEDCDLFVGKIDSLAEEPIDEGKLIRVLGKVTVRKMLFQGAVEYNDTVYGWQYNSEGAKVLLNNFKPTELYLGVIEDSMVVQDRNDDFTPTTNPPNPPPYPHPAPPNLPRET